MLFGAGKSCEPRALGVDERLRLFARRSLQRARREFERRLAQARTPTCTPRNRAGAVPCETCAACPGCPLPQFVSPCNFHSSRPATASREPQNCGVIPVYVASRSIRPSLPPEISHAICVPNWKFSRLSSIDQLLFVSK